MAITKRYVSRIDIRRDDVRLIGDVTQHDHFANQFVIRLVDGIDEVDISGASFVTVQYLLNGSEIVVDATGPRVNITSYEGGEITIIPPDEAIARAGMVVATVSVYEYDVHTEETTKMTSGKFAFEVVQDLTSEKGQGIADHSTFVALDELWQDASEYNANAVRAEALRVQAEADRVLAEGTRQTNEETRVENEEGRVARELARAGEISDLQTGLTTVTNKVNNDIYTKTETDAQIDAKVEEIGAGDMTKAVYDSNNDGVVNSADERTNATMLGNQLPSYYATRSRLGDYVPTTRTVNGKALSSNVSLLASDVGAVPTTRTVNGNALSNDITITRGQIAGIVQSDENTSKTLTMSLSNGVLTITYQ